MHRVVRCGRRGRRAAFAALLASFVLNTVGATVAFASPTRMHIFGAKPGTAFEVRRNGTLVATPTSSELGSVVVDLEAAAGDRLGVLGQPVAVLIAHFEARVSAGGVELSWLVVADEVVKGYRVYRSEGTAPEVRLTDDLLDPAATTYLDTGTKAGTAYTYFLVAIKEDGDEVRSIPASVTTPAHALSLGQNYPNPFNPSTKIPFTLERTARVSVRVFDVRGVLVATIFEGTLAEGRHAIEWSGRDDRGRPVSSGLYLYTLTTGKRSLSKKMVLVK